VILHAARWVQFLATAGMVIDCLERLAARRDYSDDGVLSARILRDSALGHGKVARSMRHAMCARGTFPAVLLARLALLVAALAPGLGSYARAALLALVVLTTLLLGARGLYGSDGSDQMDQVIVAGLFATYFLEPAGYAWIGLAFVAAQSLLSYAASGLSKLGSPMWRNGTAVAAILGTNTYGAPHVTRLFASRPGVGTVASRGVIALECLIPFVLVVPMPVVVVILARAAVMHLSIAAVMGLNKFLLSWVATYPAVIVVHQLVY
jgi:hypothetical protein